MPIPPQENRVRASKVGIPVKSRLAESGSAGYAGFMLPNATVSQAPCGCHLVDLLVRDVWDARSPLRTIPVGAFETRIHAHNVASKAVGYLRSLGREATDDELTYARHLGAAQRTFDFVHGRLVQQF